MSEPHTSSNSAARNDRSRGEESSAAPGPDDPLSPQPDPPGLSVNLLLETDDLDPTLAGWLDHHLARIARLADVATGRLTLVLVNDARMTDLHEQYRHDPTTTDVLSFDLRDADTDPLEGDLVLCVDEARRQAAARGHDTRLELLLYATHGLLHLLGEDDLNPIDARHMHAREDQLLKQAGFPPVYTEKPRGRDTPPDG